MALLGRRQRPRTTKAAGAKAKPFAYYRSENPAGGEQKSPFARKPSKTPGQRKILKKTIVIFAAVLVVAVLIYSLLLNSTPEVIVKQDPYLRAQVYKDYVERLFDSPGNQNKVTIDKNKLNESIKDQFPEITSVSIDLPATSRSAIVRINVAEPNLTLDTNGGLFIINSQGFVAGHTTDLSHIKNLPVVTDKSNFSVVPGKQILAQKSVEFISNLIHQADKSKINVASLTLPASAQELHLTTSDAGYYTKFYLSGDSARQLGQWLAARNEFSKTKKQPSQYLDVRVEGKIFYK